MPAIAEHYWTAAEVRELPDDGKRYECIDGELLVTPAPRLIHQRMLLELQELLRAFVKESVSGEMLLSPADIELEPDTLVQPDVFVAFSRDGKRLRTWTDIGGLLLAVEVLSPSTARYDRVVKRKFFQRTGVAEYWIVDLDARVIERWTPSAERPEIVADALTWTPVAVRPGVRIDVQALFAAVLD
jgi:Uma2 family endonuclease